jgi:hypothetical protein
MHSLQIYWWDVAVEVAPHEPKLAQSQGSPLELPLFVPTRKGVTVSVMSKFCYRTTYSDAAVRCTAFGPRLLPVHAMQHERQWTSRYTVGIPASRAPPGGYQARNACRRPAPQATGAEGREKRKNTA